MSVGRAATLQTLPLRLRPGDDLRRALEAAVQAGGMSRQAALKVDSTAVRSSTEGCPVNAAFVLSGIGSLRPAALRLAGADNATMIDGDTELLTLSGSIAVNGSHLHASVADAQGRVVGGHVAYGCIVRTTAEVLLALLPEWHFLREADPATGWAELVIRRDTEA